MRLSLTSWLVFHLSFLISGHFFLEAREKGANQPMLVLSKGYGQLITRVFNVWSVMGCEGISWAGEAAMLV